MASRCGGRSKNRRSPRHCRTGSHGIGRLVVSHFASHHFQLEQSTRQSVAICGSQVLCVLACSKSLLMSRSAPCSHESFPRMCSDTLHQKTRRPASGSTAQKLLRYLLLDAIRLPNGSCLLCLVPSRRKDALLPGPPSQTWTANPKPQVALSSLYGPRVG